MKKKIFCLLLLVHLCIWGAFAQVPTRGSVVDGQGRAIPNVNITVGTIRTTTNSEGRFFLGLAAGRNRLILSHMEHVSLDTLISVPLSEELRLVMRENLSLLREVEVSTGYQTVSRERLTGSFSTVNSAQFNQQVSTDVVSRLEGLVNSYSVDRKTNGGGGYGIMIRGLSTLFGPREPLIVLDNFPYEGDLNLINPNDIEQVTVLKDASAASIWGARAGNGVVVITTKKARSGQSLKINLSANMKVSARPDLFYLPQMSSGDYVMVENMLFDKGYYIAQETAVAKTPLSEVVELRIALRDGKISQQAADARKEFLRNHSFLREYADLNYRNPLGQQYALQLSAGRAKSSWLVSGGYDRNVDELSGQYGRLNLRFEQNVQLTKQWRVSGKLTLARSEANSGRTAFESLRTSNGSLPIYTQLQDENGNALPVINGFRMPYVATAGGGKLLDWNYYPASDYRSVNSTNEQASYIANFGTSYELLRGVKLSLSYQYQRQDQDVLAVSSRDSYLVRSLVNQYSVIDAAGVVKRNIPNGAIFDRSASVLVSQNARAQIDFDRAFGRHRFNVLGGAEVRSAQTDANSGRLYGVDENTLKAIPVDYINAFRNFVTGGNQFIENRDDIGRRTNRFVSAFLNAAYTFDDRYILSVSGRRDASNLYGLETNDLWNPLFSAGMAWNVSNEKFYTSKLLPRLKLRASFGASGNTDPARTAITTMNYASTSPYTMQPYANFNNYANPELRWERVYLFNAGLDFGFGGNRVSGSLEYYQKRSVDLFGDTPNDYTNGVGTTITRNAAKIMARGIDFELNTINTNGRLKWTSSLFFNFYRDEVLENYQSNLSGRLFLNGNVSSTGIKGKPVYSVMSYRFEGLDPLTGDPRGWLNGGVSKDFAALTASSVTVDDLVFHGTAMPTKSGALGNTFTYSNFTLDFRVSFKWGYYFKKATIHYGNLYGSRTAHGDFGRRWQKPGDEAFTSVPSMVYPSVASRDAFYAGSSANILKGDHLRLQYVNLSYRLGPNRAKGRAAPQIDLFVVANNLGILWRSNREGIDPDFPGQPNPRNLAFGLRTQF